MCRGREKEIQLITPDSEQPLVKGLERIPGADPPLELGARLHWPVWLKRKQSYIPMETIAAHSQGPMWVSKGFQCIDRAGGMAAPSKNSLTPFCSFNAGTQFGHRC